MEKDTNFNELLTESSHIMYELSKKYCTHDYVDENFGCSWYHSAWQFLRVLNCVSAPQWHYDFYKSAIGNAVKEKDSIKILISGTADYSMLHLIVYTVTEYDKKVQIDIVDKCVTPLEICKWYERIIRKDEEPISSLALPKTKRDLFKKNVTIRYENNDIFRLDNRFSNYDIICTDAFLTRFEKAQASRVINLWKHSLCKDGLIITTVRIHDVNDKGETKNIVEATRDILGFSEKVLSRYRKFQKKDLMNIDADQLDFFANRYIIQMQSCNLGTKEEIETLFGENDLILSEESKIGKVEGEISETLYYRIVAKCK